MTDVAVGTAVEERAAERLDARPARRLVVAAAVLAGVALSWSIVALGAWGPLEALRPVDRFGPGPGGMVTAHISEVDVEQVVLVGMVHSQQQVDLDAVEARLDDSSSLALVDAVACRRSKGVPTAGAVVGEPLSSYCESVHRPTEVTIGPTDDGGEVYVLAVIQPLEPGRVFVDGVDVTHSGRLVARVEHTGSGVELLVS